jgi:hypothetical protein
MAAMMRTSSSAGQFEATAFIGEFEDLAAAQDLEPSSNEWTEALIRAACGCYLSAVASSAVSRTVVVHDLSQIYRTILPAAFKDYLVSLLQEWCNASSNSPQQLKLKEKINAVRTLEWNEIFHKQVDEACATVMEEHVNEEINGSYDEAFIRKLEGWAMKTLSPAVALLKQRAGDNQVATQTINNYLHRKLMVVMARVRAKELFEIITDFPDSMTAVQELKECTLSAGGMCTSNVAKVLRASICKRLLHPGASTLQIVEIYVLMIRALRVLDPSDLMLSYVASPVRAYLKSRKDTVRCVVTSLSQGSESDLYSELRKGSSLAYGIDEDDEESAPVKNWEPRKRNPDLTESGTRGLDVLALLVSIYGSIDLFVSEYRSLLAEKLLQNVSYQTDHEVATLELMKIR